MGSELWPRVQEISKRFGHEPTQTAQFNTPSQNKRATALHVLQQVLDMCSTWLILIWRFFFGGGGLAPYERMPSAEDGRGLTHIVSCYNLEHLNPQYHNFSKVCDTACSGKASISEAKGSKRERHQPNPTQLSSAFQVH